MKRIIDFMLCIGPFILMMGCSCALLKEIPLDDNPIYKVSTNDNPTLDVVSMEPKLEKDGVLVEGVRGYRCSLAIDNFLTPHLVVEEHPYFRLMYMNDNDHWRGDIYNSLEMFNSSQYGNSHIEVDLENDRLWGCGYGWHPSFDFQIFVVNDCHDNNKIDCTKKFKIHTLEGGGGSLDQSKEEFIISSHGFQWAKLKYNISECVVDKQRGGYKAPAGGESEDFWVSKAEPVKHSDGKEHNIWYYSTGVEVQNSLRGSHNKNSVRWSCIENYASIVDDMCYHSISSDNVEPGTSYMCAWYWRSERYDEFGESNPGIFINIWKTDDFNNGDGHLEFDPCDLYLVDYHGHMEKRYSPRLAPAKYGGVFVGYNRGGRAIVKYIPSDVKTNQNGVKEYDMGAGKLADIMTDKDGNLHVVCMTDVMRYRKVLFYKESFSYDFFNKITDML